MLHFFKFLFSRTLLINLIIALLFIAAILFGVLTYLDNYTLHDKTIEVPDLLDHHYNELDSLLDENNQFSVVVSDSLYKKDLRSGIIIEQNPLARTTVKQGRKIYVTITAMAPPKVTMPDLVDMSLRQASSLLETFGLEVGSLKYRADLCVNCILAQELNGEEIAKGSKVPAGATIDLVVGQGFGDELVEVPYLKGLNVAMAKVLLQSNSLNMGTIVPDKTIKTEKDTMNARIYRQLPKHQEGPSVRMGSSIELFITLDSSKVRHTSNPRDSI